MEKVISGGCLCGQVKYQITGPFEQFHWCHCSRCRKATGSAHASNIFAKASNLEWLSGSSHVKRFDLAEAKRFARCFCDNCGSPLPHIARDTDILIIPAGSLDSAPDISPQDNIFWPDRAEWYEAGLTTERFERYPNK